MQKVKNLKFKIQNLKFTEGQTMIFTTIMIGSLFLMATAIAGLLMFYQLQQANDFGNSMIAIFAADANLERAFYYYFYEHEYNPTNPYKCYPPQPPCSAPAVVFSNGASGSSTLIIPPPLQFGLSNTTTITATGFDPGKRTIRLLQSTFFITPQLNP